MNKQNIFYGIIGVLVGFTIGFWIANSINRNAAVQSLPSSAASDPTIKQPTQTSADIRENQNPGSGAMQPEVARTLKKAMDEPQNFSAQIQAGEMYRQIQNADKANEFFQRAATLSPDKFSDLETLGNSFFDIKNFLEAEKWYVKALEKNPEDINVRTDLGSTYMERQPPDLDRAIKEYKTSLEKNPDHENTLFNYSVALMRKGEIQESREVLSRLEKINPEGELIKKLKDRLNQTGN